MVWVHEAVGGPLSVIVRVIAHDDCAVVPDLAVAGAHLGDLPMQPTHNTPSENIRAQSVELLNKHLAAAIDLHAQVKQAHWNVRGPCFIAIRELFDKVSGEVDTIPTLLRSAPADWGHGIWHRQRRILEFRLGRAITARK
jgi:Ferritin-like domain